MMRLCGLPLGALASRYTVKVPESTSMPLGRMEPPSAVERHWLRSQLIWNWICSSSSMAYAGSVGGNCDGIGLGGAKKSVFRMLRALMGKKGFQLMVTFSKSCPLH